MRNRNKKRKKKNEEKNLFIPTFYQCGKEWYIRPNSPIGKKEN